MLRRLLLIVLIWLWCVPPAVRARPAVLAVATVYVFLADTCPICQNATPALRELYATYAPRGVRFVGVFPGQQMRPADVILFQKQYPLPFSLRLDAGQQLTRRLGVRITPEVVVLGPSETTVLYQGRIDDAYARLGQRRTVLQHHELRDALAAVVAGQPVAVPRTDAVGCFVSAGLGSR